jgi:hypothetical protein
MMSDTDRHVAINVIDDLVARTDGQRFFFSPAFIRRASLVASLVLGITISACSASQSAAQVPPAATSIPVPAAPVTTPSVSSVRQVSAAASANTASLKLPNHFTAYASESIGNNKFCVVGSNTNEDGMNQKPVAYEADAASKQVFWLAHLDPPADMYQSRATHCTRNGDVLFVLVQSDTQSEQTLSQTLLRVVKLNAASGAVQLQQDVDVPTAYSAWVDEGSSHFQWINDRLVVTGNQRLDSDHDRQTTFTLRLNGDLKP